MRILLVVLLKKQPLFLSTDYCQNFWVSGILNHLYREVPVKASPVPVVLTLHQGIVLALALVKLAKTTVGVIAEEKI